MENGVVNLCNRLEPGLFSSTICVLEDGGVLEDRVDKSHVEVVCVPRRFGNDPSVPLRLAWLLRRKRIDVVHSHNWVTLVEAYLASKLGRVSKVIHGEHGYPLETRNRNVRVQRYVWQRVSQVTAVSNSLADDIAAVSKFPRERVAVISNGVDTMTFRPSQASRLEQRAMLGISNRDLLIGTVARLDPIKNHEGLLRAFSRLIQKRVEAFLVLAGDGPERRPLEQLSAEQGIRERVIFLGTVSAVDKLLNALDMFVLNSHREGMSNTLLEAMATGLPVVATRTGSNPELIEDGISGSIIPVNDDVALFNALESMASDSRLRSRFGEAARLRVVRKFSVDQMVAEYTNFYLRMHQGDVTAAAGT
jgi:sugar transferase (PEP-CTERM/EpsH1 system associated)